MSIQPGDVVRLKSGGPRMTVVDVDKGRAGCCWFGPELDGRCDYAEHRFPVVALELAAEGAGKVEA